MAFRKDKTGAAQTAANAAAVLVSAFADSFKNFDAAVEEYNNLRSVIFGDLAEVVDADNEVFAAAEKGESGTKKSYSGGARERKTSGGKRSGGSRGGGSITLDDALSITLNFGAFEGETLETVLGLDADACDEDYGYGDGERSGKDYITWLASDKNKNEFIQRRARVIADAEGIDY